MKILIVDDYEKMSRKAAQIVGGQVALRPESVIGLATGGTVLGMYRHLSRLHVEDDLDFTRITTFNLDEYYPIRPDHPNSYARFMQENFFSHIAISPDQTHIPNGRAGDVHIECQRYEDSIQSAGGIDLQVLGIGRNGHIGFNEPDLTFEAGTHRVTLDDQTIRDNARFFESEADVPRQAISMGIRTIMNARKIVILASGSEKSDAVHRMIYGKITPSLPASVLQLHPDVTLVVDKDAAQAIETATEAHCKEATCV